MSRFVAMELAHLLEQDIPFVQARAIGSTGGFMVIASFKRGGKAYPIVIRDTTEFGLLMFFLEQAADRAGRPFIPGRIVESGKAKEAEREAVYQH